MAYTPTLDDIHDLIPQQGASVGYTPSLADIQDLIPGQQAQSAPQPSANVLRGNANSDMSPFMSAVVGFNTGVGNLAHGILQPIFENPLFGGNDALAQGSKRYAAQREANYQKAKDANPMTASTAEFVGNVAPTLFLPMGEGGALLKLGKSALQGAGIGAAQYANPGESKLTNAAFGAGGGFLGSGAGQLGSAAIRKGAEKYAQSAMPGLVAKATDKIKGYISPEQASQKLQANFNEAAAKNTAIWNKTNALAQTLDNNLADKGKAFDASAFTNHIQDFSNKLKNMEPAVRAKYAQAADFANHIQEQAPQSFTGAVALRQNLNQELKKFLDKNNVKVTDTETKNLITGLKDSLQKTVDANNKHVDNNLLNQFKNSWEAANQSHQALTDFVKTPNPQGVLKPRIPRREALNNKTLDAGSLGQYLRPSMRGDTGINQLNKLTGGDDAARSYLMRNVIEGRGNPNVALSNYEKLSVPQRQRLFDNLPEGQQLKAASAVRNAFPEPKGSLTLEMLKHKLGGAVGTIGTLGIPKMAAKFATPQSVMRAVNRAQTTNKKAGRYLSPVLASMFASMGDNS
jgi:hypothetical protein